MALTATHRGVYVCGRCMTSADHAFSLGTTTRAGVCSRCGGQAVWLLDASMNEPRLAYRGQSETFSTNAAIEPFPTWIWDVNGYYREMGVHPRASRVEIREAYMANGGQSSDRLTYIAKQLLDSEIRSAYDSVPFGSLFMDRYLLEVVENREKQAKADAIARGEIDPDADDDDDGFDLTEALNKAVSVLDNDHSGGKDDRTRASLWGYFLWRSSSMDHTKLARWRTMLAAASWERGAVTSLGVGHSTGPDPWVVHPVGETLVVFIHQDHDPTEAMAHAAVSSINQGD
jgi:hypothetical protein